MCYEAGSVTARGCDVGCEWCVRVLWVMSCVCRKGGVGSVLSRGSAVGGGRGGGMLHVLDVFPGSQKGVN